MKNPLNLSTLLCLVLLNVISCKEDSINKNACEIYNVSTDYKVEKELGRVYLRDDGSNSRFYYIGNPDSTQRSGGYISRDFPEKFLPNKEIGELVIYSGNIRDYDVDKLDPSYLSLDLTLIEFYDSMEE